MIETIHADILTAKEDIIVHQVNCQGTMGAGLALAIKNKYPLCYKMYRKACADNKPNDLLGKIQILKMPDGKIIINMFSQLNYGRHTRQTNYEIMTQCFDKIYKYAKLNGLTVAVPYRIGCGLGGGSWPIVLNIITKRFKDTSIIKFYKM